MPLFDFICQSCGEEFEALVMGSAKPSCPKCQGQELKKKMSSFAFRTGGPSGGSSPAASDSKSSCSGCSGGSCGSCH